MDEEVTGSPASVKPPNREYNRTLLMASWSKIVGMALRGFLLGLGNRRFLVLRGTNVRLTGGRKYLKVGRWVKVEDYVEMMCVSSHGIILNDYVSIGRGSQILPSGFYSGALGKGLEMEANSSLGPNNYVGASGFVRIGRDVITGPGVMFLAQEHTIVKADVAIRDQGVKQKGITIGNGCWIGAGAIVLDGVEIGPGSVVAAGAVVTGSVPGHAVVAGVPARILRMLG